MLPKMTTCIEITIPVVTAIPDLCFVCIPDTESPCMERPSGEEPSLLIGMDTSSHHGTEDYH